MPILREGNLAFLMACLLNSTVVICHAGVTMLPCDRAESLTGSRGRVRELPIVAPAPVVTDHAAVFRDLCDNQCQFRQFPH